MKQETIWPLAFLALRAMIVGAGFGMTTTACTAAVRVEAYRGEPFGIGRVTVDLPQGDYTSALRDDRFSVTDADGRVLYPAIRHRQIGRIVRRFINIQLPNRATFYFMFLGDEPLRLTVSAPWAMDIAIRPEQDREEFEELLDDWWDAVCDRYERVHRDAEYPIVVDNYLAANWARRLRRQMPEPGLQLFGRKKIGGSWVAQLTASEAYQAAIERDLVLGRFGVGQAASVPLPDTSRVPGASPHTSAITGATPPAPDVALDEEELPPPADLPRPQEEFDVEPLAMRVPQECFYMRFGSFTNYLWYKDFFNHWQNDLGNMVVLRSINRATRDRLQAQLAIGESQLARVMGPRVIHDCAFIGFDYYLRDGASFGIIFHANNNLLLGRSFNKKRDEAVEKHPNAKLETITIAGEDVSFLHAPDGKLRSYYAVQGDFHLITTSRRLVERFLEVAEADGAGSIGALAEFQHTRVVLPLARDDTVFLYLSTPFFQNLASPAYRTELDRRLRSIGEMRVLEIARMAARAEGTDARSVDDLIAADLLPHGFGDRADGSALVIEDSSYRDSLRGTPGWFLPIADVPVERITPAEAQHYAAFARSIQQEVGNFVPVVAAFKRSTSDDGALDRISVDVRVAPYSATRIAKWARMLGPATTLRVAPIAGDVASLELIIDALGRPVHLFGGVRDFHTPLVVREGEVTPPGTASDYFRGYFGTWPRPLTLINTFLGRPTGPPDGQGISRNNRMFDLWLRTADDFFLFAFQRAVLLEVGPQLAMTDAERPAQIRLWVDNLSDKQIATAVSGLGYMRTRQASQSASRFMNSLTTQLHVPPANAREIGERLVVGRFEDPLGGKYQLLEDGNPALAGTAQDEHLPAPGARQLWASTASTPQNRFLLTEVPADYQMPLLDWFRGLNLEVTRFDPTSAGGPTLTPDALTAHIELDMVHQEIGPPAEEEEDGGFQLPSLGELFSWGGGEKTAPDPVEN